MVIEEIPRRTLIKKTRAHCDHCVDIGVTTTVNHCLILMVRTGVQNRQTRCRPVPIGDQLAVCETARVNEGIEKNKEYRTKRRTLFGLM